MRPPMGNGKGPLVMISCDTSSDAGHGWTDWQAHGAPDQYVQDVDVTLRP